MKTLVLDANDKFISRTKLLADSWANDYARIIEYRPNWNATEINGEMRKLGRFFG